MNNDERLKTMLKLLEEHRFYLWNIREQYRIAIHRNIGLTEEDKENLRKAIKECDLKIEMILENKEKVMRLFGK